MEHNSNIDGGSSPTLKLNRMTDSSDLSGPLVKLSTSCDVSTDAETSDDDDDCNDVYLRLPPVISNRDPRKSISAPSKFDLFVQLVDVISINIGSVCFIVGSIYFYPYEEGKCTVMGMPNCKLLGAILFILGSWLFLQGTVIVFFHSGAHKFEDMGLVFNLALYIVANVMFVVGSVLFIPSIIANIGPVPGTMLFIVGSFIFVIGPAFNLYRATGMRDKGVITAKQYTITALICWLYIIGSAAFVIGSFFFLPEYAEGYAITIFVFGSVVFQLSTLLAPLRYSWKYISDAKRRDSTAAMRSSFVDSSSRISSAQSVV